VKSPTYHRPTLRRTTLRRPTLRRTWLVYAVLLLIAAFLVACTGEPQTVEVTRVVEVEGEQVEVEVTRVIEVEGESQTVEVTRVIEVEVTPEGLEEEVEETAGILNPDVSGDIELWHFWGSPVRRTGVRRIVALCQEQLPNINVTETFKPFGDIWTANIAAVAAGSGMPDVIVEDRPQLPQRARDGIATNLQPFIDRDSYDTSVFWPFAWNETLYEGESYGVPFETDVRVLFWNKQAFTEAGLDPNTPPQTWEELEAYADALDIINEDGSLARVGFFPLWNAGVDFWARTNGWVPVVDGRPNVNDPAYIETLAWIQTWVDRYGGWENLQNFRASYGAPPNDLFMSGATPMLTDIAGYLSQLNFYRPQVTMADGSTVRMEWGVAGLPYNTEPANWSGGFALSIPSGAENPDAAWEFIKCMAGPIGQASWSRDTFAIPTNIEAATQPELMADPFWPTILETMEVSQGSDYVDAYPNWTEQINTRLEQVWTGDLTPQQMAEEAQAAIDETIEANQ
jgi:multiple sugar transport system substrate-binding protein